MAKSQLLTLYDTRPKTATARYKAIPSTNEPGFGRDNVSRAPPTAQLPEGGFYYPFRGLRLRVGVTQEMQHPRTLSSGGVLLVRPSVSCRLWAPVASWSLSTMLNILAFFSNRRIESRWKREPRTHDRKKSVNSALGLQPCSHLGVVWYGR